MAFDIECTSVDAHLHAWTLRLYGGRGMWVRKPMLLTSDSTPLAFVATKFPPLPNLVLRNSSVTVMLKVS